MPSRSLRKDVVPPKAIALWFCANACRPSDYCHVTAYNGKYVKSVPACTNPGGTGGTATHQHTGTVVPAHGTACPSTAPHSHPGVGSPTVGLGQSACPSGPLPGSRIACPHSHTFPVCTNTAPIGTVPAHSSHQHAAACNNPANVTTSFIQKATSVSIRKRTLPKAVKAIWTCTLASIPSGYAKYTTYLGAILKAVANACTNPGTTGGSACHTHASIGAHTHLSITMAPHTHTGGPSAGSFPSVSVSTQSACPYAPLGGSSSPSHGHGTGTYNAGCGSGTSTCAGAHSIAASCIQPAFYAVVPINSTSISMRTHGVPKKTILIWKCAIACIPTCFALANGSSCTPNLLCKYIKTVATACTNPGGTGGANSHSHTCPSTHSHTVTMPHTHPITLPTTPSAPPDLSNSPGATPIGAPHTHPGTGASGSTAAPITIPANASHVHASVASEPCNVQVAYIQRL